MADIRIGTSSFTATGWRGSFYPKGLRPADYLSYYAEHFDTVEIDSTFYATPNVSVVRSWSAKTPEGFVFAAKVPQEITHKKVLKDCDEEFRVFLTTMEALGGKLGPLLFQFGKFDKYAFKSLDDFLARLIPFLKKLPKEHQFAVEIRNKNWLVPKFADVLREHGVALTLIDQGWMPRPWEMKDKFDLITRDFTYVRWLGDRKGIEEKTTTWDKVIVDRQGDLSEWVSLLKKVQERRIMILAFANNHYAGHGPSTVDLFRRLWGSVPHFPIYTLRHVFCTRLSEFAPDAVVQRAMRHTSPETKRRYQLGMAHQVRQAVEKSNESVYGKDRLLRFHDVLPQTDEAEVKAVAN